MGKAFATWFLVAVAAAGASSPREVVQATVTRVLAIAAEQADGERARPEAPDKRRVEMRRLASEIFELLSCLRKRNSGVRRRLRRHFWTRLDGRASRKRLS